MHDGHAYRATWNGAVLAESADVVRLEGNVYFPTDAVASEYLEPTRDRSVCFWKGVASYYDVVVDGARNPGAAWCYPRPSPLARRIRKRIAFWRGVQVEPV